MEGYGNTIFKAVSGLPRVLFVCDKWCAGDPRFGLSAWEGNAWASLKAVGLADVSVFHSDDYSITHGRAADDALIAHVRAYQPDFICCVMYRMPGSRRTVPTWHTFGVLRDILKIPLFALWGDLEIPAQMRIADAMHPYFKLNAVTASAAAARRMGDESRYLYIWVPKDPSFFYAPEEGEERPIGISYVGSPKRDRLSRIRFLRDNGVTVTHTGGERQAHLTTEAYAAMYRQSKITLGFSRGAYSCVTNARVFEAMLCGAMLLEELGSETLKLYEPFSDYVPYAGTADLLQKARYYLAHDAERERIALRGCTKTRALYSAERFWRVILARMLDRPATDPWGKKPLLLTKAALAPFPVRQRILMRWVDFLCSHRLTFRLYFNFKKVLNMRSLLAVYVRRFVGG